MKNLTNYLQQRRTWSASTILVVFFSMLIMACGSDEVDGENNGTGGFDERNLPSLSLSPGSLNFVQISVGSEDQQTLRVSNTGSGLLRINSIELEADSVFHKGENWVASAEVKQNESFNLTVLFRPTDTSASSGHIVMTTNDPNNATVRVPLRTQGLAPQIFSPEVVQFSRVPAGGSDWQFTQVHNIGQSTLSIDDIILTGSDTFEISFPAETEDGSIPALEDDIDEWPATLEPDESFQIRVFFSPDNDDPATAELQLYTNDPNVDDYYPVTLSGNSGSPCIRVTHEETGIDFVESAIGQVSTRTVGIENCSPTAELEISSIEVTDTGNGVFDLLEETLPEGLPDETAVIPARETRNFVVTYTPIDEALSNGELTIRSNDLAKQTMNIPIIGKGTNNACPVAVAQGRVVGTSRYNEGVSATPLATVEFTGADSSDPDGEVARYEWTILTRPMNSNARLTPNNEVEDPKLWLDLAGTYEVELTVYDEQNLASCSSSIVTIEVVPGDQIHVQLTWDAPSVAVPSTGTGTDVDLHYLHPNGNWNSSPWDVYYANREQNWGTESQPSLVTLDIDDLYGVAPENISHKDPTGGLNYRVGVHYYSDNGYGASYATIQIRVFGQLALEIRDKQLPRCNSFWDAASISWPSGQVIQIDNMTDVSWAYCW